MSKCGFCCERADLVKKKIDAEGLMKAMDDCGNDIGYISETHARRNVIIALDHLGYNHSCSCKETPDAKD